MPSRSGAIVVVLLACGTQPSPEPVRPVIAAVAPAPPHPALPRDPTACEQALADRGVGFARLGRTLPGLERPLLISFPLLGLGFRYAPDATPQRVELMSCQLALALADAAPVLIAQGVVEIAHLGAYKYRCHRGRSRPPACVGSQLSSHAAGLALDIAGLTTADGTYHVVESGWVRDASRSSSCSAAARGRRSVPTDVFLHDTFCALVAARTFSKYVTPNVDVSHRDHVHLEVTPTGEVTWRRNVTGRL